MKVSELLKKMYQQSELTSVSSFAKATGVDKGFIDRALAGKNTVEKLDVLLEELTKDLTVDDLLLAIQLVRQVKMNQIAQDQIL